MNGQLAPPHPEGDCEAVGGRAYVTVTGSDIIRYPLQRDHMGWRWRRLSQKVLHSKTATAVGSPEYFGIDHLRLVSGPLHTWTHETCLVGRNALPRPHPTLQMRTQRFVEARSGRTGV